MRAPHCTFRAIINTVIRSDKYPFAETPLVSASPSIASFTMIETHPYLRMFGRLLAPCFCLLTLCLAGLYFLFGGTLEVLTWVIFLIPLAWILWSVNALADHTGRRLHHIALHSVISLSILLILLAPAASYPKFSNSEGIGELLLLEYFPVWIPSGLVAAPLTSAMDWLARQHGGFTGYPGAFFLWAECYVLALPQSLLLLYAHAIATGLHNFRKRRKA